MHRNQVSSIVTLLCGTTCCIVLSTLSTAQTPGTGSWSLATAIWQLNFDQQTSTFTALNAGTGATVAGLLSFRTLNAEGQEEDWRIVPPRDSVANRLSLMDTEGNVQGYVVAVENGDCIEIRPIHRTAQNYHGTLTFDASVRLGNDAFACRTQTLPGGRVVQLALGPADSRLNDSLFDVATDIALNIRGSRMDITSARDKAGQTEFRVRLEADIADPAHAAIGINLMRDYYQNRYVPYYHPINKTRCPVAPTGWMSWNVYFDTAGEKENLDEARVAAQYLKPYGMEFFSIESWQDNSPELPVSNFYNLTLRPDPNKFPSGMKWLADEIRKLGFRPGIWTVPFGTGDADFYEAHKEWFLHAADGTPMKNWCGLYVLDPSQEAVRRHMEETHRIMSRDWGYEYFKIDGMSGRNAGYSAHFYERDEVRAAFRERVDDPFRLCAEALRRGIGEDRVWLACQGHYTGPDCSLADAGRIGADIVAHRRPPDWNNYLNQARTTLNQLFVNNIIWYGDPDTLLVGTANPLETVRLAASVVALSGQAMFAGDRLAELPPERMRLLQQCLPVCDIRPLDLFPIFDMLPVWDVKVKKDFGDWDVVSLFNWDANPAEIGVDITELGLDPKQSYLVYDCWNRTLQRRVRDRIAVTAPGHGNALLAVYADTGLPQLVYSDRHLLQGGIGLEDIRWDTATKTLSGTTRLVGQDPTELVFALPEGGTLVSAQADDAITWAVTPGPNDTFSLSLRGLKTGPAAWTLQF